MTIPGLTESVHAMVVVARRFPGCVQRHNSKNGLRVDLMVEDGWVILSLSRKDGNPPIDELLLAATGALETNEFDTIRIKSGNWNCLILVWPDYG
jgi:hypothetical protein